MASIEALLGMGLGPQDNMKAMADSLRGEQRMGDYYGMSTLAPIAQLGQNMQQRSSEGAKRGGVLRQTMEREATRKRELAASTKQSQENYTATALAKTQAAQKKALVDSSKRSTESYWHPTKPDTVLNLRVGPDGVHYDDAENAYNPELLTPYKAGQQGSKQNVSQQKFDREKESDQLDTILSGDLASSVITSPLMTAATGPIYDVFKQGAKFTGLAPEVQSQQNAMNQLTAEAAGPILSKLGVNPTDKDLEVAFGTVPKLEDEPRTWIDWYKNRYAPRLRMMIERDNPKMLEAIDEQIFSTINEAEFALKQAQESTNLAPQTSIPEVELEPQTAAPPSDGWTIRVKQ